MATELIVLVNIVDAAVAYVTTPADYIEMDLVNDYLIWTKGDATVKDLMTHEPTPAELNAAAELIDPSVATTVTKCLLMDYSHNVGGAYYTHLVKGMSENKKFVFAFDFDGATATEPQLEVWDTSAHSTAVKNVLGLGTAINSMLKGVCTTTTLPGAGWAGAPLAGASNVLLLNDGLGALLVASTLYSNLKIVIPAAYSTPAAETFVLTVRFTYL
jgi:hypothetical protein